MLLKSVNFVSYISLIITIVLIISAQAFKQNTVVNSENSVANLVQIHFTNARVIQHVDKRFLSFSIDSYALYNWWKRVDLKNERLRTLTRYLQPAYLRIGGNTGDNLMFSNGRPPKFDAHTDGADVSQFPTREQNESQSQFNKPFHLKKFYGVHLMELSKFVERTNLDLIFGLNILLRNNSHWNESNAVEMLKYMTRKGIRVAGWELGNEPNRFPKEFNRTVKPKLMARDFSHLRDILNEFPLYKNSLLIGPDTTQPRDNVKLEHEHDTQHIKSAQFLRSFLKYVNPKSINAVSIHQYYFDGREATMDDFLNTTIMNTLQGEINLAKSIIRTKLPGKSLWIGETSCAYGGGTPNISNTFGGVFMWLDKLGQSAKNGVQVVIREALTDGWYSLIDRHGFPTPDYFVSLIFKKLVGERVLSFHSAWDDLNKSSLEVPDTKLRIYAHCGNGNTSIIPTGAVTLYIINPNKDMHSVEVVGQAGLQMKEYLLQPPQQLLTSTFVNLNGKPLRIDESNKYPKLNPVIRRRRFLVPGFSVGFWVLTNADVKDCRIKLPNSV